jgi:hypothetical protein
LRRQFLQDGDLPFTDVLTEEVIAQALTTIHGWLDRIFSPLVTLWVFLGQVLSADHSCRAAVARLIAHRIARGQRPCSAQTGAYCQARQRLPEKFFSTVACSAGRALDAKAEQRGLWKGRRVYLFDGTTVTMPDTPESQHDYPQVYNQKPGLGFPIARIGFVYELIEISITGFVYELIEIRAFAQSARGWGLSHLELLSWLRVVRQPLRPVSARAGRKEFIETTTCQRFRRHLPHLA